MTNSTQQRGRRGEQLAKEFLLHKGYTLVETNWRCAYGELDIVARDKNCWVFVEVRARSAESTEFAFESLDAVKRRKLVETIHVYQHEHNLEDISWRLDVVAVAFRRQAPPIIDHVQDAFDW